MIEIQKKNEDLLDIRLKIYFIFKRLSIQATKREKVKKALNVAMLLKVFNGFLIQIYSHEGYVQVIRGFGKRKY